jgi:hypothetical protein
MELDHAALLGWRDSIHAAISSERHATARNPMATRFGNFPSRSNW